MLAKRSSAAFRLPNVDLLARKCGDDKPFMCPCCGACISTWRPTEYKQAACPYCGVLDRHRVVCYDLQTNTPARLLKPNAFVAYFGPERNHSIALQAARPKLFMLGFDYFAEGYEYEKTTVFADVQHIPLQAQALDGVFIMHVLEHVPNLKVALNELRRVLRPGAFLHHETPCYFGNVSSDAPRARQHREALRRGFENCTRARRRGRDPGNLCVQKDHLWGYSCDYLENAIRKSGFACSRAPARISQASMTRFIGPSQLTESAMPSFPGRVRCSAERK